MNNSSDLDIYVRAYTKPKEANSASVEIPNTDHSNIEPEHHGRPTRILVIDTETTNDEKQVLEFGYFEILEKGQLDFHGLFYNENIIREDELAILNEYCTANDIPLMTRREFNNEVFYPEVFFKETCCVGFNLPFDLSRIALDFGYARDKTMLGGFSFKLSTNMEFPRVLVKHINNTMSFIKFGKSIIKHTSDFKGNFVDLRTLGWAIRNKKYSLDSACKEFSTEIQKKKVNQHGKITTEYIDYCIGDVRATFALFNAMLSEYQKYAIELPLNKGFSPASIGKALLHKMAIADMSDKISQIPDSILGYIMSTYYGGRSEVRIRKTPMPVVYMDFLSMYPTVCILMDLWKFISCDHIEYADCTSDTIDFIDNVTLETLTHKEIWRQMTVIVEVEPHNGDILPVRAKYDGQTQGIGINHLEGNGKRLWYTIHDVIASKLLTGKTPKITRALRFVPIGIQRDLVPIEFLGRRIDPEKDDFFKALIEYRKELQAKAKTTPIGSPEYSELQSNQYITKIIANATSYGIFIELNEAEEESEIEVFGLDSFTTLKTKVERPGSMFNPILAVLITGASRLMLGMAEAYISQRNGRIAFCDTDSIAVNPEVAKELQQFFKPLNPYSFHGDILKIEDDNYKLQAESEPHYSVDIYSNPLLFFGISAKRYVLFRKNGQAIKVIKCTEHGLGSFVDPFGQEKDWIQTFWEHALADYYHNNGITRNVLYSQLPAASKQVVSTKTIMERFARLNKGRDYDNSIKPFNFFLVGAGSRQNRRTRQMIVPTVPFTKNNIKNIVGKPFIDYKSGRKYVGQQYWRTLDEVYS
ncbi:MAG: DNA polymerase, partial [Nitrososphaera sp.]